MKRARPGGDRRVRAHRGPPTLGEHPCPSAVAPDESPGGRAQEGDPHVEGVEVEHVGHRRGRKAAVFVERMQDVV
jgi:hypothetical protein